MKVTVNYYGQLRQIAGREAEALVYPAESVPLSEVIADAAKRYGAEFHRMVFDEARRLRPSLMVLVNGAAIAKDSLPLLKEGDQVTLLPAIAGG